MKAINILWDVDVEEDEDIDFLPDVVEIPDEVIQHAYGDDVEETISDYLTDLTGYCHRGFELIEE